MLSNPIVIAAIIIAVAITWRLWFWLIALIGGCLLYIAVGALYCAAVLFDRVSNGYLAKRRVQADLEGSYH